MDVADLLAKAKRTERTVDLFVGDQNLTDRYAQIEAELRIKDREARRNTSLADPTGVVDLTREQAELQDQIQDDSITLRLRAMPRREWAKLVTEHPPRDEDKDRNRIINVSTFFDVAVPATIIEFSREQYEQLDGLLSQGEWDKLCGAVWVVNAGSVDVPFSRAASPTSPTSDET